MSISTDSIGPKHGTSVSITGAQIELNATHGTFQMIGLDDPVSATCGYYLTLTPPFASIAIEGISGATGGGSAVGASTLLPANVWPAVAQYVPVHVQIGAAEGQWGAAKIGTDGSVYVFSTPNEAAFDSGSTVNIDNIVGGWSVQQF
jgi:hypothetical protein